MAEPSTCSQEYSTPKHVRACFRPKIFRSENVSAENFSVNFFSAASEPPKNRTEGVLGGIAPQVSSSDTREKTETNRKKTEKNAKKIEKKVKKCIAKKHGVKY